LYDFSIKQLLKQAVERVPFVVIHFVTMPWLSLTSYSLTTP